MDKIGIGIVGAGYWGPNLIRNFDEIDNCEVVWVCDQKPGRQEYVRERYPQISVSADLDKLLKDDHVEGVVIATPVYTHRDIAMKALKAGKHVWVEKPLADSVDAARDIVEEAGKRNLTLAVDHLFVYNPAIVKARELVAGGKIGEICYAESSRVNLGPPESEVDVVWDLAVHDLAITYYLWGELPRKIIAYGGQFQHSNLTDVAFIYLHFDDGTMATHYVSWLCPEKTRRYFISGNKGSLVFDDTQVDKKLRLIDQGVDSRIGTKDDEVKELFYKPGEVVYPKLMPGEPLRAACENFLDCMRNGTKPRADGHAGLAVVKMLEAVKESIANGGKAVELAGS